MLLADFSMRGRIGGGVCAFVVAACFFVAPLACADIFNPSFEIYDPNGALGFPVAIGWEYENYAADVNCLQPEVEFTGTGQGNTSGWPEEIVSDGLPPIDGGRLLMLSNGHIGSPGTTKYATAWQRITAQAGDRIRGYYFFGTVDYLAQYDDRATITLVDSSADSNDIEIISVSVADVGNYSSMDGWEPFEYVFNSITAGEYDLTFHVEDVQDSIVNSYLGIDDLQYCPAPTSYGDLNYDCQCDNSDLAILSEYWLYDCQDPNDGNPYVISRECAAWFDSGSPGDVDNDDTVDIEDFRIILTGWLSGEQPY